MVPLRPSAPSGGRAAGLIARALVSIILLFGVVLAGCGTPGYPEARLVVDGQASPCVDEPDRDPDVFLQCPYAIRLLALRLGLEPGDASALELHRGLGCAEPDEPVPTNCGAVVAWFESEAPIMVRILPHRAGGFATQNPETPPQAILDHGPAETSPPP